MLFALGVRPVESGNGVRGIALEQRRVAPHEWLFERRRCDVFRRVLSTSVEGLSVRFGHTE